MKEGEGLDLMKKKVKGISDCVVELVLFERTLMEGVKEREEI